MNNSDERKYNERFPEFQSSLFVWNDLEKGNKVSRLDNQVEEIRESDIKGDFRTINIFNELEERFNKIQKENAELSILLRDTQIEVFDLVQQNKRYREARLIIGEMFEENVFINIYDYENGYLDGLGNAIGVIDELIEKED